MNSISKRKSCAPLAVFILLVLCGCAALGASRLVRILPISLAAPQFRYHQPLGPNEALAFSYMRLEMLIPFEVYILEEDRDLRALGQGLVRLNSQPHWSPDGDQVLYLSNAIGRTRMVLASADGEDQREIDPQGGYPIFIRWSPDGSRLAYLAYPPQGDGPRSPYLCVTEPGSGEIHRTPAGTVQDLAWTADGESLLAVVWEAGDVVLKAYDPQGRYQGQVAAADQLNKAVDLALSPDGSQVAYLVPVTPGEPLDPQEALWVSSLDGSHSRLLAEVRTESALIWSPDSTRIAFIALTDDYHLALMVAPTDGGGAQELMRINEGDESGEMLPAVPAWSPDSQRIAISSVDQPDSAALYVLDADGGNIQEILSVRGSGMIYTLAWRPNR